MRAAATDEGGRPGAGDRTADAYLYSDRDRHRHAHLGVQLDAHAYAHGNGNGHCNGDVNRYADTDRDAYRDCAAHRRLRQSALGQLAPAVAAARCALWRG